MNADQAGAATTPDPTRPRMVVAEVTNNWPKTPAGALDLTRPGGNHRQLVSGLFEVVIAENERRGYRLDSWQFLQTPVVTPQGGGLVETIVAVFVLRDEVPS